MGTYYDGEGWEAIVTVSRPEGTTRVEVYIIALAEKQEAERKITGIIGPKATIKEMVKIEPGGMEGYQLHRGGWTIIPIR